MFVLGCNALYGVPFLYLDHLGDSSHDRGLGLLRAPWVRASSPINRGNTDCLISFRRWLVVTGSGRWQKPDWGVGHRLAVESYGKTHPEAPVWYAGRMR